MHNIYIRPLSVEDAETSFIWRNDADIWEFTGSKPSKLMTRELEREWLTFALQKSDEKRFAIIVDEQYVGNIQLTEITNVTAQYHIFIGNKDYWGIGVGQLASFYLLEYAKEELGLKYVKLEVKCKNERAVRLYNSLGFKEIAIKEDTIEMSATLVQLPKPKLSVFVIVYNHEFFLRQSLDSILIQHCDFSYDIVVGEDCSTDNSRNILVEVQKKYPGKLKLLLHERNIGAAKNQIKTMTACKGKYVAICEGDDYWTDPYKLQKQVDFLEANNDFAICFHKVMLKIGDKIEDDFLTNPPTENTTIKNLIEIGNFIHTPSVVFRNKLKKLPIHFNYSPVGDYFLYILLTDDGSKIKCINETMAVYRYGVGIHSAKNNLEKHWAWYEMLVLIKSCSVKYSNQFEEKIKDSRKIIEIEIVDSASMSNIAYKFTFVSLLKLILKRIINKL